MNQAPESSPKGMHPTPTGSAAAIPASKDPGQDGRLISPVERISEILFGLIMALTFTCTLSVVDSQREDVRDMLIGAVGCNIAWGLVDAIMYLLGELSNRGHGARVLKFIRGTDNTGKARNYIADALPPVLTEVLSQDDLELLRKRLLDLPETRIKPRLNARDFKIAFGIFLLVFISTFPVAIPFLFLEPAMIAIRVSNGIAILLMFTAGWQLARYGGYNKWLMALAMAVIGVLLVMLTIALGG